MHNEASLHSNYGTTDALEVSWSKHDGPIVHRLHLSF